MLAIPLDPTPLISEWGYLGAVVTLTVGFLIFLIVKSKGDADMLKIYTDRMNQIHRDCESSLVSIMDRHEARSIIHDERFLATTNEYTKAVKDLEATIKILFDRVSRL